MAEFPLAGHSETVSKVLSSVLPPRSYAYLSALLPGFYLEISVCLANPKLLQQLIASSNEAANLGRYPKILIAVFLAFVLGTAFMFWATFVNRILEALFRMNVFLWEEFCAAPILSLLQSPRIVQSGLYKRRWMRELVVTPVRDAALDMGSRSDGMRKLWAVIAKSVFEKRYDINLSRLEQEEWDALYQAVGGLPLVGFSDHLHMIVSQALGWSGLVAIWFAPALISQNYIGFNLFLIGIGILYQWRLLRGLHDDYTVGLLRVRALIKELRRGGHAGPENPGVAPADAGEPPPEDV